MIHTRRETHETAEMGKADASTRSLGVSGVLVLLHWNDNITLFVPLVNIPVSLGDLLQGKAAMEC
ncbi:MAG TPA: hypothetical protein VFV38_19580 [Ktedonobacteraceae bacterium]|nr:hypothetical protein [Ktedonobacteraceae bacterium]